MKPETRTINNLFETNVRYVVPLYQRPYVWNKPKQWEPLWGDILILLEHQVAANGFAPGYSHFLGAIVLDQETQAPGRIPQYTVIDGQQRLTTLLLLIAAARSAAEDLGATTEAGLLADLMLNDLRRAQGDERLKVWPTNINRLALKAVLLPDADAPAADDPANRIQEGFSYFKSKALEWVLDGDEAAREERITTLRVTLSDLLKVVSITLEPGDNAQIIFETLNARGTPLLALDLVKNAVFRKAGPQGPELDKLYDESWKPELDLDSWRRERRQGRLLRAHGELFLMHWLGMKLRRVVPASELFDTFRTHVIEPKTSAEMPDLVRELNRHAKIYREFDEPDNPEAIFFERLEVLDVTTVMPLVLLLFTNASVETARRARALAALESWLVRRMLLRLTTKNYNREIADLMDKVAANPGLADEVVCDHLSAATSDTNRWPDDAEIQTSLETTDLYTTIAQGRLTLLLRAYERKLSLEFDVDIPTIPPKLSIEHLMPQKWKTHWGLPKDLEPLDLDALAAGREARIHRLGNLTLTTIKMNQDLSNSAWPQKQKKLNRGSKLSINSELIERYGDLFDESAIDERTTMLAKRIVEIWPRPARKAEPSDAARA